MTDTAARTRAEQLLIDGGWRDASSGRRFDVTDPATGEVVGSVPDADAGDVTAAIDAAAEAFPAWSATPAIERGRLLRRASDLIRDRRDAIAAVMTAEQGKPLAEAAGEVDYAAGFFEWFAGEAERVYGQIVPPADPDKRVLVLRQPVGVTAAITPWNFPAAMLTRKLGPALAAGCTSVVKPAEATPLTAVEVCRALIDAGAPAGVVNLITSSRPAEVGEVLMADPRVRKLSFTGSTEVGKALIRRSADQVMRLSLELGGHAPAIVFEDADLDEAVTQVMASKFRNAGQTCVCANRIYVQRAIHDRFRAAMAERIAGLRVGRGTDAGVQIGPLIDDAAVAKVRRHVEDAMARGAELVVGDDGSNGNGSGHFYTPTLLDGITTDMLIASEETFGPVAGLTVFDTEDEAIALANDTPFGLAAYLLTRDYARMLRVAERLEFGIVGANDGAPSVPSAPFGGVKQSGFGREGGDFGIDEYLNVKYVSIGGVSR
ncbi:MAG TPA: NAD-dependent succinate-semialdehyde dehydrogenase [Gaiellales bacterium]|jgi:succinate-semialdehyde dehydrogenase/glutarate-semialdehyde dehydrogenase